MTVRDDLRLYPVQTAEKGIAWLRLVARGRPGHGSMRHDDNAVTRLAEAVARIGRHEFPVVLTKTVRQFLEALSEVFERGPGPRLGGPGGDRRADRPARRAVPDGRRRR